MKFILISLTASLSLILFACGEEKSGTAADETTANQDSKTFETFDYDTLKGVFTGDFGDSPITIALTYVSERHATGYNVVRGKRRNLSGNLERNENGVLLTLSEPGDDKYDGVFKIRMTDQDQSSISGEWESKSGEVKNFSLKRVVYDDADYDKNTFSKYGETFSDSLGTLYFESEGTVTYEYYINEGSANEQRKVINGSWKFVNMNVSIFWQPNDVFPTRKSTFLLDPEKEMDDETYKTREIRGENRILSAIMW